MPNEWPTGDELIRISKALGGDETEGESLLVNAEKFLAIEIGGHPAFGGPVNKIIGPTVNNDSSSSPAFIVGSRWIDITADKEYVCVDSTVGAAVWLETTAEAGSGEANTASSSSSGGEGLVLTKAGVDLPFKGIKGGTGLTVSADANDVSLAHDVHTGEVTGATALTIATAAVTNAKLANMPQATVKGRASGAGTGVPVDLTATQLRAIANVEDGAEVNNISDPNAATLTDGSNADALHVHAGVIVGGWELLSGPHTDSGASSRTFTVSSLTDYRKLWLAVWRLVPGTDDREAWLQVNGDTGNNYGWTHHAWNSFPGAALQGVSVDAKLRMIATDAGSALGSSTGEVGALDILLPDFRDTSKYKNFHYVAAYIAANTRPSGTDGRGSWRNAGAITSIKFYMEASATYSAVLALYGLPNS